VDWEGGKKACEQQGLKLAKLDNIQTDVYASRQLEDFIIFKGWIHNWCMEMLIPI